MTRTLAASVLAELLAGPPEPQAADGDTETASLL